MLGVAPLCPCALLHVFFFISLLWFFSLLFLFCFRCWRVCYFVVLIFHRERESPCLKAIQASAWHPRSIFPMEYQLAECSRCTHSLNPPGPRSGHTHDRTIRTLWESQTAPDARNPRRLVHCRSTEVDGIFHISSHLSAAKRVLVLPAPLRTSWFVPGIYSFFFSSLFSFLSMRPRKYCVWRVLTNQSGARGSGSPGNGRPTRPSSIILVPCVQKCIMPYVFFLVDWVSTLVTINRISAHRRESAWLVGRFWSCSLTISYSISSSPRGWTRFSWWGCKKRTRRWRLSVESSCEGNPVIRARNDALGLTTENVLSWRTSEPRDPVNPPANRLVSPPVSANPIGPPPRRALGDSGNDADGNPLHSFPRARPCLPVCFSFSFFLSSSHLVPTPRRRKTYSTEASRSRFGIRPGGCHLLQLIRHFNTQLFYPRADMEASGDYCLWSQKWCHVDDRSMDKASFFWRYTVQWLHHSIDDENWKINLDETKIPDYSLAFAGDHAER